MSTFSDVIECSVRPDGSRCKAACSSGWCKGKQIYTQNVRNFVFPNILKIDGAIELSL